jgi:2-dehydropantoate 2-reductase
MTIQNGLGAEEIVAAHGDWPLLSAVTFMSGTRHGDAHVEYVLDTATWIGPYRGTTEADAAGVELHDDPWEMNVLATQRGHRHFPSMLEDVEARRPTEVELINGALVREAERHEVSVPLQTALYRLVKAREASYSE